MKDQDIKEIIKDRYGKIARGETVFCCPSCGPTVEDQCLAVGYSEEDLRLVPDLAILGVGCGNPTALADLHLGGPPPHRGDALARLPAAGRPRRRAPR